MASESFKFIVTAQNAQNMAKIISEMISKRLETLWVELRNEAE